MTAPAGSDAIQLHFCQSCGISIPQPDIDSGRARPAPGGYVCPGCVYQRRDVELTPRPAPARAPEGREAGSRLIVTVALLYVVGVTTFLLLREIQREPPAAIDLGAVAQQPHIDALSRKLDQVDDQTRRALADLKSNDLSQRQRIERLGADVQAAGDATEKLGKTVAARVDDLGASITDLAQRTVGIRGDVESVLQELRGIGEKVARGPVETVKKDPAPDTGSREPEPPARSKEELEQERLMGEYIAKLKDKNEQDQARYNAAVQLGDIKHADAVIALQEAVEKDGNDLVRRAAAWSLGMLGKLAVPSIPALIAQIGGKEEYVGYMCERALGEITKSVLGTAVTFNFDPTMSRRERQKVQKKWEEWWTKFKPQLLPG